MRKATGALWFAGSLASGHTALAQTTDERTVTTTSESTGTVSEFGPEGIVIRTTMGETTVAYPPGWD